MEEAAEKAMLPAQAPFATIGLRRVCAGCNPCYSPIMARTNRRNAKSEFPPAVERARSFGNPLHFLLRASGGSRSTDTLEEHQRILQQFGSVWIGKWGAAVGSWALEIGNEQLEAGVPT